MPRLVPCPALLVLEFLAYGYLASKKKRFGIPALTAEFERAEILVPCAFRYFRPRLDPDSKLIQVPESNFAVVHSLD